MSNHLSSQLLLLEIGVGTGTGSLSEPKAAPGDANFMIFVPTLEQAVFQTPLFLNTCKFKLSSVFPWLNSIVTEFDWFTSFQQSS